MAEKKMTKKDYFTMLSEIVTASDNDKKTELMDFINHEIELLDRKKNYTRSMTPHQKENLSIMDMILNILDTSEDPLSVGELQKKEGLTEYSNQRITAVLNQLCGKGSVVRLVDKRKAYYKKVAD